MDEPVSQQLTASTDRLAAAAEALESALARLSAQQEELSAKVERIVAAIDERLLERSESDRAQPDSEWRERIAELERANSDLKAQAARLARKTLSPLVSSLLAKNEVPEVVEPAVLDKALSSLSPEQRIAVKAEMARAGLLE
ncbi:MAG TPA: hypothetical protein VEG30_01140 [Terriglobales bacterium]|nr:hypothetical protein [Terriglobales bacterium]